MRREKRHTRDLIVLIAALILVNVIGSYVYKRFDLTQDKRYTLSDAAKETIASLDSPLVVDVFLEGNFPPEFRRLQIETKQLLEEFANENPNIHFEFLNPIEGEDDPRAIRQQLSAFGLNPAQVEVQKDGKISTELVYPWALAYYNEKTVKIQLLKNQLGTTSEERVNNSIQNLEYAFADGFGKLIHPKKRKVAVLKGNGELEDRYIADFFTSLREYYFIAPFTLDSAVVDPIRTLDQLNEFDLVVVAQPSIPFTDSEKYILDQFTMSGGASLWLVDATENVIDTTSGRTFAFPMDLNLGDMFFKYGVRINPNLIKDVYSAPIVLATGNENESLFNRYPWFYSPLSASANNHPIVSNIEAVKFDYVSGIDILENAISKTVLLSSSPISKIIGLPKEIDLDKEIPENLKVVNEGPGPNEFQAGEIPLAVLLEGKFNSAFTNRIKPFDLDGDRLVSEETKMVVIGDGEIIKNQLDKGRPLELGFDKFTQTFYGNKEFLLNTVNYLLDDSGLIRIRTKEIAVPFLDPQRTSAEREKWQLINLGVPLVLIGCFALILRYFRKRKYMR